MDIRSYLAQGKPLLFDGAMGTYFAAQPGRAGERCERANVTHPEEIKAIHRAYLEAGCRAIKTNTFSVGADLAAGEETLAEETVRAGCRLALEEAEPFGAYVFADLGPAPESGEWSPAEMYLRQADWFLNQGLTCFLAETLATDDGIPELARYLKEKCPEAFLIVSFAVDYDGVTRGGLQGRDLFRRTAALENVDAVGFNCVSGPSHLLKYIQSLDLGDTRLSVMPNAGYPTVLGRRTVFQGRPDYFADQMAQIVRAGAAIVGGCCGTTPAHMARTAEALANPLPPRKAAPAEAPREVAAVSANSLWEKLERGQRVIAVELDPPVDDEVAPFLEGVRALQGAGAEYRASASHDLPGPKPERHQGAAAGPVHGGGPQCAAGNGRPYPHREPGRGEKCFQL